MDNRQFMFLFSLVMQKRNHGLLYLPKDSLRCVGWLVDVYQAVMGKFPFAFMSRNKTIYLYIDNIDNSPI